MNLLKRILPDLLAVVLFAVISFVYFYPADIEGRVLFQHDSKEGVGAGVELNSYHERTGEYTRWTNSIFGGMPTYQMAPSYDSTRPLSFLEKVYHLFLPQYVWYVFALLLGFYILLRAFNFSVLLASLGAIVWAFSSYFFILISAGHIWKLVTLAYIPPTIAGMVLIYRGKLLQGGLLTAVFVALQILSNHVQMSYYFLFVMFFLFVAFGVEAYRSKQLPRFWKATGVLVVAGVLGVLINASNLYHTYQYSKETMRSKSELVKTGVEQANQTKSGLDRDYITQWSYGIGETFTLLVPNLKGGASVPLAASETAMQKADPMYAQYGLYNQLTQYFGDQPMTSGPVYVGAFVLFLFVLGLFILKGPLKWALVGATLLSILLSWGKNFMFFTDLFLDFMPMYDKFRAVSSILVIAEFTIPLLALLTLKKIVDEPDVLQKNLKYLYVSFGLTGGLALLFALAPTLFFDTYVPAGEMTMLSQALPPEHVAPLVKSLEEMRMALFTADAWRSFFLVVVGVLILLVYNMGKLKVHWMVTALIVLCLGDMWAVNKRYLNDEQFVPASAKTTSVRKTPADEYILQDKTLDYRVLNLASNTFNESTTSYWHKSIGGYHAAKLRRYQELIDYHIAPEMNVLRKEVSEAAGDMTLVNPSAFPVLNMLNSRYFIFPGAEGQTIPLLNPYAFGNAWIVDRVKYVANANEEMEGLAQVDLRHTALVDVRFQKMLKGAESLDTDSLATIALTSYEPNKLVYQTSSTHDVVAVFSEIYYPGWTVKIDGEVAEHVRADYVLRAMCIPAGKHVVEFTFNPQSLHITEGLATGSLVLLLIGAGFVLFFSFRKKEVGRKG